MISAIGWIGSALCVSSLVQKNQLRFRALNLGACIAMIAFNTANGTWSMVLLNVIVSIINIRQIIRIRSEVSTPIPRATPGAVVVETATSTDPVVDHRGRQLVAA